MIFFSIFFAFLFFVLRCWIFHRCNLSSDPEVGIEELRPSQQLREEEVEGAFLPARPIRVHVQEDDNSADRVGIGEIWDELDSPGSQRRPIGQGQLTQQELLTEPRGRSLTQPPPAYGRWRNSVRVDPKYLHWKAVEVTETGTDAGNLPSPRYEDAVRNGVR
ncbi:hypothetical protein K470DRAFT_34143 [Piedraia hortae CBS 480.64]|uniref:Uncharacterized protein n=1 Tax=Piedraia hortae CBS 480.64 TaxID=1314780 RepID=A0A6A7C227_9PEZI|nr:hypothetical protein K470DRAFT_34143 [Piedraia hortae CBS 480.64]